MPKIYSEFHTASQWGLRLGILEKSLQIFHLQSNVGVTERNIYQPRASKLLIGRIYERSFAKRS